VEEVNLKKQRLRDSASPDNSDDSDPSPVKHKVVKKTTKKTTPKKITPKKRGRKPTPK